MIREHISVDRRPAGEAMTVRWMHQGLQDGSWERMTMLEQMGNLGTEVARAARAKESGDEQSCQGAFNRALELFELTVVDDRWRGPRRRELCLMREIFIDFIAGDNTFGESAESLDRYFLPFAVAARTEAGRA